MPDYDFYRNGYKGDAVPPEEWPRCEARASEQLAQYKRLYTVTAPKALPDGEALAVCAMAEALYGFDLLANGEGGPVQSASIGSVSVSYGTAAVQAVDLTPRGQARELYRTACRYLDICRGGVLMVRVKRREGPVDYRLCDQTVTVYHRSNSGEITRTVIESAFLDFRKTQDVSKTGSTEVNSFLLVIPCAKSPVAVGDKVLHGVGPEIAAAEDWREFIPATIPGLVVVKYADPKYWKGRMVHVEAGG